MKKKSVNLGFRGWMLVVYLATALMSYQVFTNYPLNILSDFYGGAQRVSTIYTAGAVIAVVIQVVLAGPIRKIKSIKKLSAILGAVTLGLGLCIMLVPFSNVGLWQVCYGIENIVSVLYATFAVEILVGQWFPTRKGTVMGIATLAFPITNGMIGFFASSVYKNGDPEVFRAFLPFFLVALAGWLIGQIFIRDYPEQCGCYRDNDRNMSPEAAQAMLKEEQENKKTTVWTLLNTFRCRDFWLITLAVGGLVMFSVGLMTQTSTIISTYEGSYTVLGGYQGIMVMVCILGCIGSYVIGLLDTKFGTKKAFMVSLLLMIAGGFIGSIPTAKMLVLSLIFLALLNGASSNFALSIAAQYWRREDFSSVFAVINPITNIMVAFGPMIIARLLYSRFGYQSIFLVIGIVGIIALILAVAFRPSHVKEVDDRYRKAAGKPLDSALEGRK